MYTVMVKPNYNFFSYMYQCGISYRKQIKYFPNTEYRLMQWCKAGLDVLTKQFRQFFLRFTPGRPVVLPVLKKPQTLYHTDAPDGISLLSEMIKSKSSMYFKARTPILVDNRWFDDSVDTIDPGDVERVSFSTHASIPGDQDGNGIIIIHIKKNFISTDRGRLAL